MNKVAGLGRRVVGVAGVLGILTVAGNAPAESAEYNTNKPPAITGVALASPSYAGGPVSFVVSVFLDSKQDARGVNMVFFAPGAGVVNKPVELKAKTTTQVTFTDPGGLSLCIAKDYIVSIGAGQVASQLRKFRVTPTCTFASKVDYPWNQQTPDNVEAQQKGNLWLNNVGLDGQPSCSLAPKLKGSIVNHSKTKANDVKVDLVDEKGVSVGSSAPASPAASASSPFAATANLGTYGKVWVKLVDPTNSAGGHIANGYISAQITPSCTLALKSL